MNRIRYVAANTFREAVRDRVFYNLIFFALLLVASAPLLSQISIGLERIFLINLSLTAMALIGVAIAIFFGTSLVSKEMERRTLYTLLARPVRRWEFILGKYLGLALTLTINLALMSVGFFAALFLVRRSFESGDERVLLAIYLIGLQLVVVTALSLLFSSFTTPIFSILFTLAMFVIGSFAEDLRGFAALAHGPAGWLAGALSYIVPNFGAMNVTSQVAHGMAVSSRLVLLATLHALFYIVAALSGAALIFQKRNLK